MKIKKKQFGKLGLIFIIFIVFFWVFAPDPSWNLPSESIYRLLIPKYPNAENIKNNTGCGFEFEVGEYELEKVKTFYENSLIMNTFFNFQKGRSSFHQYSKPDGGSYYQDFSNSYGQRFNLTSRSVQIYGANYTKGTIVQVRCGTYSWLD